MTRKTKLILLIVFCLLSQNVWFSQIGMTESLFGVYGRNNGALFLSSLIALILLIILIHNVEFKVRILRLLSILNISALGYFFIQLLGADPIEWNQIGAPTSFLGNPNFLATFLAFTSLSLVKAKQINRKNSRNHTLRYSIILLNLAAQFLLGTLQGLAIFFGGMILFFISDGLEHKPTFPRISKLLTFVSTCGALFIIIFTLSIRGKLSNLLDLSSIQLRIEYWKIGLRAFRDAPLLGYGMDSYLYVFDEFKGPEFVSKYGSNLVSSSSHNVFLDYFVSGGVLIGLPILFLNLYVSFLALRIIFSKKSFNVHLRVLSVMWLQISVQNLVSIQYPSIVIWQTVLGIVIYLERFSNQALASHKANNYKTESPFSFVSLAIFLIATVIATIICLPVVQEIKFADAIKKGSGDLLIQSVRAFPLDTYRANYAAEALQNAGYWYWSKLIAETSVENNPRNEMGWRLIAQNQLSSAKEVERATSMVWKLDPSEPR